ncbi:MAG: Flp pilus assembly complex ATPase component TadA [Patescibacteria group bacterium]|nr:Flp pilus assembly complex ATPase component TadA [Patescibacteria group bacterium]
MIDDARILDEQATQRRARIVGLNYFDTSKQELSLYKDLISLEDIKNIKIVPLYASAHLIRFGITNNTSQLTVQQFRQRFQDQTVEFYLISDSGFRELVKRYDPPKQIIYQDIDINTQAENQISTISSTLEEVKSDDTLAYLVKQAFQLKASDIHLETDRKEVRIRFRVDGVLHPIAVLSTEKYKHLTASLAVAANLSTESRESQTGHINKKYILADGSEVEVNLRVETVPAIHGMDAVLRLFNLRPELMKLDKLGLRTQEREVINDIINHPKGLLLIVGPTGSGKTTTLYSIINELNSDSRKIITLEDPVEYNIKGVTQIPVDSRLDSTAFARSFRAVLRLDPDVVMVGEIRDNDTAKTALQSALTGHLVVSTYHAGSASAALTRLLGAIEENPLFTSAIRLVQAQRLLRRLDDTTKQPYTPDTKELDWLRRVLDTMPESVQKPSLENLKLFKPLPTPLNPFGFKGLFAVRELLTMTPDIEAELRRPIRDINTRSIESVAIAGGMTTLLHEGVLKVIAGETSLEEVLRTLF